MKSTLSTLSVVLLTAGITACTSNFFGQKTEQAASSQQTTTETTLAGGLPNSLDQGLNTDAKISGGGMDGNDNVKMTRALDKPLGKATTWSNGRTGTTYTVTPTSKVTINGNPFCRRYTTTIMRNGSSREQSGTACVASDGNWHPLSG